MSRKRLGYNVYHAPAVGGASYLGRASSLREARRMAAEGGGLGEECWETARQAGHCGGYSAPSGVEESSPTAWFGRGGHY